MPRISPVAILTITLALTFAAGCAGSIRGTNFQIKAPLQQTGCQQVSFDKQALAFNCDALVYDLLKTPIRSRRIYDILTQESYTRRHFVVQTEGRQYVYRTEQLDGVGFPARVLLETRRGFMQVQLNQFGQVVSSTTRKGGNI